MARVANLVCRSRNSPGEVMFTLEEVGVGPRSTVQSIPRKAAVNVKVLGETDHSLFQKLKVV